MRTLKRHYGCSENVGRPRMERIVGQSYDARDIRQRQRGPQKPVQPGNTKRHPHYSPLQSPLPVHEHLHSGDPISPSNSPSSILSPSIQSALTKYSLHPSPRLPRACQEHMHLHLSKTNSSSNRQNVLSATTPALVELRNMMYK